MRKAARHIAEVLNTAASGTDLENKIHLALADPDIQLPFANYTFEDLGPLGKNGVSSYKAIVFIFTKSLTSAFDLGDDLVEKLKNQSKWYYRGGKGDYVDAEAKEAYVKLTFEFKY